MITPGQGRGDLDESVLDELEDELQFSKEVSAYSTVTLKDEFERVIPGNQHLSYAMLWSLLLSGRQMCDTCTTTYSRGLKCGCAKMKSPEFTMMDMLEMARIISQDYDGAKFSFKGNQMVTCRQKLKGLGKHAAWMRLNAIGELDEEKYDDVDIHINFLD